MSNGEHVYKTIEITGSSTTSIDDAIRQAIAKASQTVRHLDWFELTQVRGTIADGSVGHLQTTLKIGFRLE
jgi:flavin-binding protein dodecin